VEGEAQPREGWFRRWKAPRVRRNVSSFAGEHGRRPFPTDRGSGSAEAAARERRTPGELVTGRHEGGVPRRRQLQPAIGASLRHEVSEPIGLGRSFHRERSWWKKPRLEATKASDRGPWPVTSRLAARLDRKGPRVAIRSSSIMSRVKPVQNAERRTARAKLYQRATAGGVLRSSDGRGRARGSHRLQKSTGGAWPLSPTSEEHVDHEQGSSPSARERTWGERASEAGSSAAKRRDRWRAPNQTRSP